MNANLETINAMIEQMDGSFKGAMLVAELDYARSLLDQEVTFKADENGRLLTGTVESIHFVSGRPVLDVEAEVDNQGQTERRSFPVQLDAITSIAK